MSMRTLLHFNDNETNINLWIDNRDNPFHIDCENGHVNTVQFLLDNGADINLCKNKWASLFHIAFFNGHANTV